MVSDEKRMNNINLVAKNNMIMGRLDKNVRSKIVKGSAASTNSSSVLSRISLPVPKMVRDFK
jgi:hypothetical protein